MTMRSNVKSANKEKVHGWNTMQAGVVNNQRADLPNKFLKKAPTLFIARK